MKIHIKTLLPIIIGGSILFSSCHLGERDGCEDQKNYQEHSISQNTLNQIPYRKDGLDTLVYISTNGDTAVLYGTGVKKQYLHNRVNESLNPDCLNYTDYKTQVIDYTYVGDQFFFDKLVYYVYNYVSTKSQEDEVTNYATKSSYHIAFMENSTGVYDYGINNINDEKSYNDSIIVDNIILYGKKMHSTADGMITLYNKKYGAIKVEIGGKTWIKKF